MLSRTSWKDIVRSSIWVLAIAMSAFHFLTAAFGSLPTLEQRSVHLGFAMILILLQDMLKENRNIFNIIVNAVLIFATAFLTIYVFINWQELALRTVRPLQLDLILGVLLIITVLYTTKLKLGWALPIIALVFLAYALFGNHLGGKIGHRGYSVERLIAQMFMSTEGIYGTVLGVSATYIFLFVLFGALLEYSGAANFFIDLAASLFGKKRGGSAKVSIVASGLFGMVSGSAVANVMAIGPITTPMMVKTGYTKRFSGATIAVAGTGGQFMPPIMGAAAFIIAETLGVPYVTIALSALIPGILYYAALWIAVDMRTQKDGIEALSEKEMPNLKTVILTGSYLAIPFVLLVLFLALLQWSPLKSGFWAIIATVVISWVKKASRMGLKEIAAAFHKGALGSLDVAVVCATAGIIVGVLSLTGLGLKFSSILISLAAGNKFVLLVLTAISALILGMGMTTTSVYIVLSVLVAPALVTMGVPAVAAHLYVFYFGILSAITPPVATASFAAASVVKDEPFKLGFVAWKLGLAGYILPFMFVYNSELLMMGNPFNVTRAVITSLIGVYALSAGLEGFLKTKLSWILRIVLIMTAFLLLDTGILTDVIGIAIVGTSYAWSHIKSKQEVDIARNIVVQKNEDNPT